MNRKAAELLERWIAEWVRPVPAAEMHAEAARLAAEFTAYAADAGIRIGHVEEDLGEDLASRMEDALKAAGAGEPEPRDTDP
jgi:hypothetical protein